jgi:dinuclear metal center YbgI/SA1388 family protein
MVTAADIADYLDHIAPSELAESWDNTGLLLGRRQTAVQRLLTCLTLTQTVADEAVEWDARMIVTHHPILFRGTKRITDQSAEGRLLLTLAEAGIVVFSPHTRFDSCANGINQRIAESLELRDIRPMRPLLMNPETGTGRTGILPTPVSRTEFLGRLQRQGCAAYLEYSSGHSDTVRRVAIGCGAASELLEDAVRLGCDTFVTGEARFHSVLESQSHGINLVLMGHFASEHPGIAALAAVLAKQFPTVVCRVSAREFSPLHLFAASAAPGIQKDPE